MLGCQRKGKEAYERGEPRDACPYQVFNQYNTGPKNLLNQRRQYWEYGWDVAKQEEETSSNDEGPTAGPAGGSEV